MKLLTCFIYTVIVLVLSSEAVPKILRIPIQQREIHSEKYAKRANNVSLYNANGKEYLIEIGIGSPPQFFNVTLDTASSDCWVPAQSCPTSMCPHARFNNKKSSSFNASSQKLDIEYGFGFARGTYATDTLTLNGVSLSKFTLGLVSNTYNILMVQEGSVPSNGIFGLGYPNLSRKTGAKPAHFVMDLYEAKTISEPVFSIFLNTQSAYGKTGEIVLGGIDSSRHAGKIQYAPVISYDISSSAISPNMGAHSTSEPANNSQRSHLYWTVPGQGVNTSRGYKYASKSLIAFILDTGTALTYVRPSVAESIVMSVTRNAKTTLLDTIENIYHVSCSTAKLKGTVSFLISSSATNASSPITIRVPISNLVIPLDDARTADTSKLCMFGIAPSPVGLDLTSGETWILGESVLRSIYTVYDLKENRVGLAKLADGEYSRPATAVINATAKTTKAAHTSTPSNSTTTAAASSLASSFSCFLSPAMIIMMMMMYN